MLRRASSPRRAATAARTGRGPSDSGGTSATLAAGTVLLLGALLVGPVVPVAAFVPSAAVVRHIDGLPSAGTASSVAAAERRGVRPPSLSLPVAAPAPFAMVGFELPGEHVEVAVRASADGRSWGPWTAAPHLHGEGPDAGSTEAVAAGARSEGTHPVWTGAATHLQVRVAGAPPEDVRVALVDPLGLGRGPLGRAVDRARAAWDGRTPRSAGAVADQPTIVTRAEWGADESMRTAEPSYARRVEGVFVHHTVGPNSYSAAEAPGVVNGVYAYHVQSRGWSDIGYNLLVDRFGTVYEGRYGGVDRPVIGAQAMGFNTGTTGVALLGTFSSAPPPQAALDALDALLAWKLDHHHVDPLASREQVSRGSTRYEEGVVATLPNVTGHRDVQMTDCPGDGVYALLPGIRERVRARIGAALFEHRSSVDETRVIRGDPEAEAVDLAARLDPPGPWSIAVRNDVGVPVHAASGDGAEARTTWRLDGSGWATGSYTWTVSSPGRRTAEDVVALQPPAIVDARPDTASVRATADGRLRDPVRWSATLWRDAAWTLTVTASDGTAVHRDAGTGDTLDSTWAEGVRGEGPYAWRIAAEDSEPQEGIVEVRLDRFPREAEASDEVGAAVDLSRAAFGMFGARHAVLARADVFADAMSGGPLAGPDGPLLLTASGHLDERVDEELSRVLLPGSVVYLLGGEAALSPAVASALSPRWRVVRLFGAGRAETAAAVARELAARTSPTVALVARAGPDDAAPWADALSGGAYGAAAGVPVLLTDTDRLPAATSEALDDLGITRTFVLGGEAAVSAAVAAQLPDPVRIAGADRTATAVAVARELWGRALALDGDRFVLGNGYAPQAWPLALAAAPLAARSGAPLLLSDGPALASPVAAYLTELGYATGPAAAEGVALGGEALLSQEALDAASDLAS